MDKIWATKINRWLKFIYLITRFNQWITLTNVLSNPVLVTQCPVEQCCNCLICIMNIFTKTITYIRVGSTSSVPVICTVRVPPKYVINYEHSSRKIILKMSFVFFHNVWAIFLNRLHRIQNHTILNCVNGTFSFLLKWDTPFPPSKMLKKHWNSLYLHAKL